MNKILLVFFSLFLFLLSFNAISNEKLINENIKFKPFKIKQINNLLITYKYH